ncbi:MAG: hypothetical protein RSE91_03855, partial [Bacilli bacterium]
MKQANIINRIIEKYPYLSSRKIGFPYIGGRLDNRDYSTSVKSVADGFEFYDDLLKKYYNPKIKDYNFTSGNP